MVRVVVIDDRVTNRNVLTRLASSVEEGVQVRAFACPLRALDWLAEHTIDLLISDYKMPALDGASLIRRFRGLPGAADVPVVVITVYEDRELRYAALEAGATDFLISPVDPIEFRARARNLLTMRKQQRRLGERADALSRELSLRRSHFDPAGGLDREQLRGILDHIPAGISVTDRAGRILYANQACGAYLTEPGGVAGKTIRDAFGDALATRIDVLNEKVFQSEAVVGPFEDTLPHPSGGEFTVLSAKAPLPDQSGHPCAVVTCLLDVSHMGGYGGGAATRFSLPSRMKFKIQVRQAIERARAARARFALHVLDLDRFKGINDAFGPDVGDRLLDEVASRLRNAIPADCSLAQLSGDAFALLQVGLLGPADAQRFADQLLAAFGAPFVIDGEEVHAGASVGSTLFPDDAETVDQLLANAEHAMYRAKASGRNAVCFFARPMTAAARRAGLLEHELRQALADDQFTVHYQPTRDLRTGELVSVEALLRWQHPERGLVPPTAFIGFAEGLGLIGRLTERVLERACARLVAWRVRGGLPSLRLSVNIAPMQLQQPGFAHQVEATLHATGFDPAHLELELTERVVLDQGDHTLREIDRLRRLGVTFSLDDFGTGYASLADVRRLPIQGLKIDRSFVHHIGATREDEAIVHAIVDLGRRLHLRITAEGVETPGQLRFVTALGCDEAQGDLISPPLPAEELEALLETRELSLASG